jgi:endonuclease/exonuclease/phosphatase (EEP) superfamily protein YafD
MMSAGIVRSLLAAVLALSGLVATASPSSAAIDVQSAPGEVVVVTVNALQRDLDDARLGELVAALASRPAAQDGRVYAPDVIVVEEIVQSVLVQLRDRLNATMGSHYEMVGLSSNTGTGGNVKTKILLNTSTMALSGHVTWTDVCDSIRIYQLVTAKELATGQEIAVAGVHLAPNDNAAGSDDCRSRNATKIRQVLAPYDARGSVLGDFNRRAAVVERECDIEETSAPMDWYTDITSASTGRSYIDSVRSYRRSAGLSMADQWTFEDAAPSQLCDGATGYRRYRLDYIFHSDALQTIEATADTPGWGDAAPGAIGCQPAPACKYSDHRFVWSRLALPTQPQLHLGDLDATRTLSKSGWRPAVTATVHDGSHAPVSGALVTARWSTGDSASCTTGVNGACQISGPQLKNQTSTIRLTVSSVTKTGTSYAPADTHDPDGDSSAGSILVAR